MSKVTRHESVSQKQAGIFTSEQLSLRFPTALFYCVYNMITNAYNLGLIILPITLFVTNSFEVNI